MGISDGSSGRTAGSGAPEGTALQMNGAAPTQTHPASAKDCASPSAEPASMIRVGVPDAWVTATCSATICGPPVPWQSTRL